MTQLQKQQKKPQTKRVVVGFTPWVIFILIIAFIFNMPIEAKATSSGSQNPSTYTIAGSGSSWVNAARIYSSDDSWSYVSLSAGSSSEYVALSDFGFSIPAGATIDGITVNIERQASGNKVRDQVVQLTKDLSTLTGSNYAATSTNWPKNSDGIATYGGAADLWGTSWTVAELNSSNFGLVILVENKHGSKTRTAYVDHVNITVEYTVSSSGGSGGASEGPGGIASSLGTWLKADAGVVGTTDITQWADQSGNANNANDVSSTTRPSLATGVVNFNDALYFDGVDEYLESTSGGYTQEIFTVFVPTSDVTYTSSGMTLYTVDAANPSALAVASMGLGPQTSGLTNEIMHFGAGGSSEWRRGVTSTSQVYNAGLTMIMNVSNDNTTSSTTIYIDGTSVANATNGTYINAENDREYRVGGNLHQIGSNYFDGYLAEVIIFSEDLSAGDRTKVESYLAIKYGVTLDDDYVLSDGTTIWSQSTNSSYHNDVTGIALDDNSLLDQPKSKSQNSDAAITIDKGASFSTDLDAIIWGNDNGALTKGAGNGSSAFPNASSRTWKVELNGTPGTIDISIDLSVLNMEGGTKNEYALLIDDNSDFTSGSTSHTTGKDLVGSILSFTNVSFTDGYYFTIGSNFSVVDGDPGGVSANLATWLKADAGVTGTTGIVNWADQSGNGNDAEDVSSSTRPNLESGTINFNDAINFDGVDEYLQGAAGGYTDEVFMVVMPSNQVSNSSASQVPFTVDANNPSSASAFLGFGSGTSGLSNEVIYYGSGSSSEWRRGETSSTQTYDANRPMLLSVTNNNSSTSTALYVNSSQIDNTTGSGSYVNAEGNVAYRIGGNMYNWGSSYFDGQIAEIITYSSILSADNREMIESYLAMKYGITKSGDYTISTGTTIWDATANSTYHNNIIFIGRDDDSELDQRQSHSISDDNDILTIGHGEIQSTNSDNGNSFSGDGVYLITGHNNGNTTGAGNADYGNTTNAMQVDARIYRTWKVQETGVGTVRLKFDLSSFVGVQTYAGTYDFSKIILLVDDNTTFSSGALGVSPVAYDGTEETVEFEYNFDAGVTYLSIGTSDESGNAPLPVEFNYFNAKAKDDLVQINWGTAMENNNDKFEIECSQTGINWEMIAQVKGAGNSLVQLDYNYTDLKPHKGTSYYRIKQIDLDGTSEYSEIETVYFGVEGFSSLQIMTLYPNPLVNELNLAFKAPVSGRASIQLLAISGNLIKTETIMVNGGTNNFNWNLSDIKPGTYILRLVMNDSVIQEKIIKN